MEHGEYLAGVLTLVMLAVSAGFWVDLIRQGLRSGWNWPVVPRPAVPWRLMESVAIVVAVMLCTSLLMKQLFESPAASRQSLYQLQMGCLVQVIQLILLPLIFSVLCRCHWADFGIRFEGVLTDLRFAGWGLLLAQLPVILLSLLMKPWREAEPHAMFVLLDESAHDVTMLVWIGLTVVVTVPLLEELLFRVLLQGALDREVRPVWAILLTAAAFASAHSFVDSIPLLPLALVLGYVYYRRQSYLAVVMIHGAFNALNLLYALLSLPANAGSP